MNTAISTDCGKPQSEYQEGECIDISCVILASSPGRVVIAGDTKVNRDDDVSLEVTARKVYQIDSNLFIGITGDFEQCILALRLFVENQKEKKEFTEKSEYLSSLLKQTKPRCFSNVILVGTGNAKTQCAIFESDNMFTPKIKCARPVTTHIRLTPPDIHEPEEFYTGFINDASSLPLRQQVINCIGVVSKKSISVNDKIVGYDITVDGCERFSDNIDFNEITFRELDQDLKVLFSWD